METICNDSFFLCLVLDQQEFSRLDPVLRSTVTYFKRDTHSLSEKQRQKTSVNKNINAANSQVTSNGHLPNDHVPNSHLPNGNISNGHISNGDVVASAASGDVGAGKENAASTAVIDAHLCAACGRPARSRCNACMKVTSSNGSSIKCRC